MKAEQVYQPLEYVQYLHLLVPEFWLEAAKIKYKPQDQLLKYAAQISQKEHFNAIRVPQVVQSQGTGMQTPTTKKKKPFCKICKKQFIT